MFNLEKYELRCAAATTILAGAAVAAGAAKAIDGKIKADKAKDALESYQRQDITNSNPYENMRISTIGADLMREEQNRRDAALIDAVQQGGTRSLGSLGAIAESSNRMNRQIAADLDNQMIRREYAAAGDDVRTRQMMERREEGDLAGIGQMMNVGQQQMWDGVGDAVYGGMAIGNSAAMSEAGTLGHQQVGLDGFGYSRRDLNNLNNTFGPTNWMAGATVTRG